jgi:hypothetical protein
MIYFMFIFPGMILNKPRVGALAGLGEAASLTELVRMAGKVFGPWEKKNRPLDTTTDNRYSNDRICLG